MKVLISGGGTGGHIFPALAIANELKRRRPDAEILFVGAQGRMEMERVPDAGYDIVGLPVAGFDRKRLWRNIAVLLKLQKSLMKARKIVRNFKPDIAVGVGGYASGPVLKAAQRAGIPTLLQEQNSYAGVTNKLLAKKAKAICVAYDGMNRFFPADRILMTGNPIRAEVLECPMSQARAKEALGFDPQKALLLIVGGSLGASTINEAVASALPIWVKAGVQVMWQTGKLYIEKYAPIAERYPEMVKAMPFIKRMDLAYRAADLVVSRAGACSVSEIQLLGKSAVLVPSPNVAEDHQRRNAEALVNVGAAEMVLDADAVEQLGPKVIELLRDDSRRRRLGEEASRMALRDSAAKIVDRLIELAEEKT